MIKSVDFSCSLPGRGVVLRDLTFSLAEGITAVVGLTGAGSSTLLNAIAGQLPAGSAVKGRLHVSGIAATRATPGELARRVRLVSPTRLGAGTVAELLATWQPEARVPDALAEFGLERWRDRLVATLPPDARSALCLAQLRHARLPGVVAIDQVLTPCGPALREEFLAEARRLADAGRCVLWADHGIDELWEVADGFLELSRGELAAHQPAGDWRPLTVREPVLLTMARALGLPALQHRTPETMRQAAQQVLPVAAPRRGSHEPLLDAIRVRHSALGLEGDGELQLGQHETLGIIRLDGRGEDVARRLVQALRGARQLPSTLPSDVPTGELARGWEKAVGLSPGSVLDASGAAALRPERTLARHGSGDVANLRTAMAAGCPVALWLPHPQAMLDSRRTAEFAHQLRRPQPAPRLLTSRDHDFLLAACHRLLVCDGNRVAALGTPEAVARHIPQPPLLARATGSDVVALEQLLPSLAEVVPL
ncbi:hypothetical protein GCM10028820_24920 [Tessaracoccus terricola]